MVRVLFQATTLRASLAQELYATLFSQGKPGNLLGTTWGWARPYECWEGYSWPARGGWPASLPKGSHHRPGLGSGESSSKYLKAVRFFWWIFIDFAQKTDKIHLVDICFQLLVTFSQDCFSGGCCSLSYTFQWISGGQWANAGFAGPLWFWGRWNDCKGCFIHVQTASHSWSDSLPAMTGFPYQWLWAIPDQLLPTSKPGKLCFIFFSTRKVSCQEIFKCKPWGEKKGF